MKDQMERNRGRFGRLILVLLRIQEFSFTLKDAHPWREMKQVFFNVRILNEGEKRKKDWTIGVGTDKRKINLRLEYDKTEQDLNVTHSLKCKQNEIGTFRCSSL